MKRQAIFVAATGQNVGKTTTCLGLVSGLQKKFSSVGFLKPVGQESVQTNTGIPIDKDVLLFKAKFNLKDPETKMSPVLFPKGFTRDYLDGKIQRKDLIYKIKSAFKAIAENHDITVVEGTGHTAVGSIVDLNNAQVAALLDIPIVLVASGGLGSAFDELSLNYIQCQKYGAKVAGVILNRVLNDKRDMVLDYMPKALKKWGVPLLGLIPYDPFLTTPTMGDFELLFEQKLLCGAKESLHHFDQVKLLTSSSELDSPDTFANQLMMTSSDQEEMILDLLKRRKRANTHIGFILTGSKPTDSLLQKLKDAKIPTLHIPLTSTKVIQMINSYIGKIRKEDTSKIKEAIRVVEKNIDFGKLIETLF